MNGNHNRTSFLWFTVLGWIIIGFKDNELLFINNEAMKKLEGALSFSIGGFVWWKCENGMKVKVKFDGLKVIADMEFFERNSPKSSSAKEDVYLCL